MTYSVSNKIQLIQEWITVQAEKRPEATALVMGGESLTYGQVESLSNQLARALKDGGGKKGDRVAILLPKSPIAIIAVLGALKADCVYVPLDVSSPVPRLSRMLLSCQPKWMLSASPNANLLQNLMANFTPAEAPQIGWLDNNYESISNPPAFLLKDLEGYSDAPTGYDNGPNDLAYILFTSGSTGDPKGVMITHSNVSSFVDWAVEYFGIGSDDKLSGHSPLYFDLSVFDIFGAFASGAQLHLVPEELNILPHKLAAFIRESELTQWFSVPSALRYMVRQDALRSQEFPHLKRLLWCGEELSTPVLRYLMAFLPEVSFTNLYGPTEATIASSYYTVPDYPKSERELIPIGVPCDGEELLVLNEELQPNVTGEIGDLYIKGVGLSPGYWHDQEKTDSAFLITETFGRIYKTGDLAHVGADGLVYFHGRSDSQIKSRGYRIELGEIEASLSALDSLMESAVVSIPAQEFEGQEICLAYVPMYGVEIGPIEIRKELAKTLPNYMLPSHWKVFDRLPSNANGKIDRPKLRDVFKRDR